MVCLPCAVMESEDFRAQAIRSAFLLFEELASDKSWEQQYVSAPPPTVTTITSPLTVRRPSVKVRALLLSRQNSVSLRDFPPLLWAVAAGLVLCKLWLG